MVDYNITCARCKKPARISAEGGELCLPCWRKTRAEKREQKQQDSLDICFSYINNKKVTEKEAKIICEVMEELNKDKPVSKKK